MRPVAPPPPRPVEPPKPQTTNDRGVFVLNELSTGEMEARRRALEGATARDVEDRQRAAADAKRRAEEEERRRKERDDSARRQAEEEARIKTEAESRRRAEEEARRRAPMTETSEEESDSRPRTGRGAPLLRASPLKRPATPDAAKPTRGQG